MGKRPAVSANTMSIWRALAASTASKHTAALSPLACEITVTSLRSPHSCNCSRAAARKVSPAAKITDLPCAWKYFASLPMDVVLPAPLMPASIITNGSPLSGRTSGCSSGLSNSYTASFNAWRNSLPSFSPLSDTRSRTSFIRYSVASMPMSLVSSTVSSSSYKSSSICPPPNTLANDFAMWSRDLVKPCFRRAAQPSFWGSAFSGCVSVATVATVCAAYSALLSSSTLFSGCPCSVDACSAASCACATV